MSDEVKPEDVEYIKASEVARILLVTPQTIRNRIKEKVYPGAIKPGRDWLIPKDEAMNSINKRYGDKR